MVAGSRAIYSYYAEHSSYQHVNLLLSFIWKVPDDRLTQPHSFIYILLALWARLRGGSRRRDSIQISSSLNTPVGFHVGGTAHWLSLDTQAMRWSHDVLLCEGNMAWRVYMLSNACLFNAVMTSLKDIILYLPREC